MSNFTKNCENTGKILWNLASIFSGSHKKFSLVLLQMTNYIFSPWKMYKRMQYALNYSGTRFLPWPKIKITQFPSEFRHNPLEWKYDGTEPFHGNCSEGERLKRPPRLTQLTGQCNITVPRHRQKLLAWTALACLQQLLPPQGFRPEAKSRGGTLVTRAYI